MTSIGILLGIVAVIISIGFSWSVRLRDQDQNFDVPFCWVTLNVLVIVKCTSGDRWSMGMGDDVETQQFEGKHDYEICDFSGYFGLFYLQFACSINPQTFR